MSIPTAQGEGERRLETQQGRNPQTAPTPFPKHTPNSPRKILWVKPFMRCGMAWGEPALGLRRRS